jgi:hypothetical protein
MDLEKNGWLNDVFVEIEKAAKLVRFLDAGMNIYLLIIKLFNLKKNDFFKQL